MIHISKKYLGFKSKSVFTITKQLLWLRNSNKMTQNMSSKIWFEAYSYAHIETRRLVVKWNVYTEGKVNKSYQEHSKGNFWNRHLTKFMINPSITKLHLHHFNNLLNL